MKKKHLEIIETTIEISTIVIKLWMIKALLIIAILFLWIAGNEITRTLEETHQTLPIPLSMILQGVGMAIILWIIIISYKVLGFDKYIKIQKVTKWELQKTKKKDSKQKTT